MTETPMTEAPTSARTPPANVSSNTSEPPQTPPKRRLAPVRTNKLIPTVHTPAPVPRNALRPAPKHSSPRPSPHDPWLRVIPAPSSVAGANTTSTQQDAEDAKEDAFGAFETWLDKDRDDF